MRSTDPNDVRPIDLSFALKSAGRFVAVAIDRVGCDPSLDPPNDLWRGCDVSIVFVRLSNNERAISD